MVKTDIPLKVLVRLRSRDLLALTGDEGAEVLSTDVVELQEVRRSVDFVQKLSRDGERYLRHLEFQGGSDPEMLTRCLRYKVLMTLQYGMPVLTTVVYLLPPAPVEDLFFEVRLGGRKVNRWRFESLRLWEVEACRALSAGTPGLLALVPLMRGGGELATIEEAGRRIEAVAPAREETELFSILQLLAGQHYTSDVLRRLIGRRQMIDFPSSVIDEFMAKGEAQGQISAEREVCAEMVRKYHPALTERAFPLIEACTDLTRLKAWILSAADLDDDAFERLLKA